jgi:hypothetical protein
MARILIDKTQGNKRSVAGVSLCKYCNEFLFPNGKIINHDTDKNAVRMPNGQWKCSICVQEDLEKTTKLMNRHKP